MIILLSKSSLHDRYSSWLRRLNADIHLSDAYSKGTSSLQKKIRRCSGILLTGGSDMSPSMYGKPGEIKRCKGIDEKRDALEMELIETALKENIPLLGICRGIQMINVVCKGTLIVDIPADHGDKIMHFGKSDVYHEISTVRDSILYQYGKALRFTVNSSHHQALDLLGEGLIPVARSDDNLVESVQLKPGYAHPFFLGVQWHPERMEVNHPMADAIGKAFLKHAAASGRG